MKKTLFLLFVSTAISSAAFADGYKSSHSEPTEKNGYYVRADIGVSSALKLNNGYAYENNKVKRTALYNIGVGKYLSENFRADLSASIRNYKLNAGETPSTNQKIQSTALMLNGYYDIGTFKMFTPYVSAGAGIAQNKGGTLTINDPDYNSSFKSKSINNFAWQVGAGSAIKLAETIDLDLSYKFMDMGKVKTGSGIAFTSIQKSLYASSARLKAHEFAIGVRYSF